MKPIPVVWSDLEIAFERNAPEVDSFLRRSTGEVATVIKGTDEADRWQRQIAEDPDEFIHIEACSSREQYRWMEGFVVTVVEPDLRQRLMISIDGKGAFRRFKDVLLSYPAERERWFGYRARWLHYHINRWLAKVEVPCESPPPWGEVEAPDVPEPLARPQASGESVVEILRRRVHDSVELLPAGELPAALAFMDFLRERGSTDLSAARVRLDTNLRRLAAARAAASRGAADPEEDDAVVAAAAKDSV